MNFLKKTLCIAALFAIGSLSARASKDAAVKASPARATKTAPIRRQSARAPIAQANSYQQIRAEIIRTKAIDPKTNLLTPTFIAQMKKYAENLDAGKIGLRMLLQMGRDFNFPATNDDSKNLRILNQINLQIQDAVDSF